MLPNRCKGICDKVGLLYLSKELKEVIEILLEQKRQKISAAEKLEEHMDFASQLIFAQVIFVIGKLGTIMCSLLCSSCWKENRCSCNHLGTEPFLPFWFVLLHTFPMQEVMYCYPRFTTLLSVIFCLTDDLVWLKWLQRLVDNWAQ